MTSRTLPSSELLRIALRYDQETGALTWRTGRNGGARAGAVAGCTRPDGYIVVWFEGSLHRAHRLIWALVHGEWPAHQVDHVNGDRADNRLCNLRHVTDGENKQNQHGLRAHNTSGTAGVGWHKAARKWRAHIGVKGKARHLGLFDNKSDAIEFRELAQEMLHPFAKRGVP